MVISRFRVDHPIQCVNGVDLNGQLSSRDSQCTSQTEGSAAAGGGISIGDGSPDGNFYWLGFSRRNSDPCLC